MRVADVAWALGVRQVRMVRTRICDAGGIEWVAQGVYGLTET